MRPLTDIEIERIQKVIMTKEISSAEILMEVYDHYISHLQEFSEEKFEEQLSDLEQKFTYGYCHSLQYSFNKQAKQDISKTQWRVIRKYFCFSRWLYLAGILAVVFFISSQTSSDRELGIMMFSPMLLLLISLIAFHFQSFKKLRPIKKAFKGNGIPIHSSLALPISERMYFTIFTVQMVFYFPKLWEDNLLFGNILPALAAMFTVVMVIYVLSLIEVWKIKSKTTLI
ncbi:hypothetical protein [Rhodonellum sp.]|uniref:hypothetical protein n=1 Tax=Rhodonellum sp. TaxID=2231180 RepID=UPI002720A338|nr:hypothetical protein [Rhodonellum sp.]MDO9553437.1 hypothetical protein [Rhodonellum sp.]